MSDEQNPVHKYAQFQLDDAGARLRFQHEFSLAGFRTLILINGGAIIALLTYAGNALDRGGAKSLAAAFIFYVFGVATTTTAYVFAYYSQQNFTDTAISEAVKHLGIAADPEANQRDLDRGYKRGWWCIVVAVVLSVLGLLNFIGGSLAAMSALT